MLKLLQSGKKKVTFKLSTVLRMVKKTKKGEISKLELKPLPHGLNYAYLKKNEEKPMVIYVIRTEE